jgi:WD40 repeat protein
VLETELGRERVALEGHSDAVLAIAFSRDGRRVATLSSDRTARVFEAATGQTTQVLRTGSGTTIEFSPDGQRLLIAHPMDFSAKLYPATAQALLDTACALLRYQPEWVHVETLCADVGTGRPNQK